jgi:hypothetical protein
MTNSNRVLLYAAIVLCSLFFSQSAEAVTEVSSSIQTTNNSIQFPSLALNGTVTETVMFYNPGSTVSGSEPLSVCIPDGSGDCFTADFTESVAGNQTMCYESYCGGPCNSSLTELDNGALCWVQVTYDQNTFEPANGVLEVSGFIGEFQITLNASPATGDVTSTEMFLQTTSETEPNAHPFGSPADGLYGNNSTTTCNYSSDTTSDPCWNPLEIDFDAADIYTSTASPTAAVLGNLAEPYSPTSNLLNATNSVESSDGGAGNITASFGCNGESELVGSIVETAEDGGVFTFTVSPGQACNFSSTVNFTFTSSGGSSDGDAGSAVLYSYANSELSGTYTGTWDDATTDTPLTQSGSGTSNITLAIANDFTVTGNAFLPAGSLGTCQASDETFTTDEALALGQGIAATVAGYATGGMAVATVGDTQGDVLWLFGSTVDAYGNQLPAGELFFSSYVAVAGSGLASCPGSISWDAPFKKQNAKGKPVVHPRRHSRAHLPRKWRDRGAFRHDASDLDKERGQQDHR